MNAGRLVNKLLDVVVDTELGDPDDDFVRAGLALLSLAISRLPAKEQEFLLWDIEDCGALRRRVRMFPSAPSPLPRAANGHDTY